MSIATTASPLQRAASELDALNTAAFDAMDSASLERFFRDHQLRATLPIRRVVEAADVAALAVHIMTNTALTGAIYDIDGGSSSSPPRLYGQRIGGKNMSICSLTKRSPHFSSSISTVISC